MRRLTLPLIVAFCIFGTAKGETPSTTPKVDELRTLLKAGKKKEALAVLKEIETLKANHAEAKALVKVIKDRKLKLDDELLDGCFHGLKGIGSRKVTKSLFAMLKFKKYKKDSRYAIGICKAIEGSADPKAIEGIVDFMRGPVDQVIAAAGKTAGAYRHASAAIRKELFKEILKVYVPTWNMKNSVDPEKKKEKRRAEKRWPVIRKSMEKSLQLLSDVSQPDPPAWQRWWNKNKRKKWTAPTG